MSTNGKENGVKNQKASKKNWKLGTRKEAEYLAFIKWSATPAPLKPVDERTQSDFAKKHELDESTLSLWKQREDFWPQVKDEIKASWVRDKSPEVIFGLWRKAARDGTAAEVRLWMQYAMDLIFEIPQFQTNIQVNVLNMNDEQLLTAIKEEIRQIKGLQAGVGKAQSE